MVTGTGYFRPSAAEVHALMLHRRWQLLALTAHARAHDEAVREELAQLDRDIEAGIEQLEAMEEEKRHALGAKLRERTEAHGPLDWASVPVTEIMTADVMTLHEEDDLAALATDIDLTGHRSYPVVDGESVVGLITHRELLSATLGAGPTRGQRTQTFVATLMRRDFAKVGPDAKVRDVATMLQGHDAPCVLVVGEADALRGIVTKDDLLRLMIEGTAGTEDG